MIVYTCVTNNYDELQDPPKATCQHICFSDQPVNSKIWEYRPLITSFNNPFLTARFHKLQAFKYMDDNEFLWQDGKVVFNRRHTDLFSKFQGPLDLFAHHKRKCIYDEAKKVIVLKKENPQKIEKQISKYREKGYPKNNGLFETCVFMYNLKAEEILDAWWAELKITTVRDQLSLPYILQNFPSYKIIEGMVDGNPYFHVNWSRNRIKKCYFL